MAVFSCYCKYGILSATNRWRGMRGASWQGGADGRWGRGNGRRGVFEFDTPLFSPAIRTGLGCCDFSPDLFSLPKVCTAARGGQGVPRHLPAADGAEVGRPQDAAGPDLLDVQWPSKTTPWRLVLPSWTGGVLVRLESSAPTPASCDSKLTLVACIIAVGCDATVHCSK